MASTRIHPRTARNSAALTSVPVPTREPIPYPSDTEDRLCSVAGSIRSAARSLEHLPEDLMAEHGDLLDVLHLLQVIEKEVNSINYSAVELQGVRALADRARRIVEEVAHA